MNIPFLCVALTFGLIYLPRLLVIRAQMQMPGGLDNNDPRAQQAAIDQRGKRANAAHANAFEDFAPFAAAVVLAHLAGADATACAALAVAHVVARTVYPFLYIAGLGTARTGVWSIGFLSTIGLFGLSLVA